jgi:hypothetical protein
MGQVQIKCINKPHRDSPVDSIVNVGGVNPDGSRWKLDLASAVAHAERGDYQFFVQVGLSRAEVEVATRNGKKYLRTVRDATKVDNLLSLPECP